MFEPLLVSEILTSQRLLKSHRQNGERDFRKPFLSFKNTTNIMAYFFRKFYVQKGLPSERMVESQTSKLVASDE